MVLPREVQFLIGIKNKIDVFEGHLVVLKMLAHINIQKTMVNNRKPLKQKKTPLLRTESKAL